MLKIAYFAKVVSKQCFGEAMLEGRLFLNRLSYYKEIEDAGRSDPDEASIVVQGSQIENLTIGDHIVKTQDVVSIKMQLNWMNHFHILSMVARGFETEDDTIENFRKQLAFPGEKLKPEFGEHCVVIHNTQKFIDRVEAACKRQQFLLVRGGVKYYDPEQDTVGMDRKDSMDAILYKPKEFRYQKEYRFGVWTNTFGCDPLILDIGPIHDIAFLKETDNVAGVINISPRNDTA